MGPRILNALVDPSVGQRELPGERERFLPRVALPQPGVRHVRDRDRKAITTAELVSELELRAELERVAEVLAVALW